MLIIKYVHNFFETKYVHNLLIWSNASNWCVVWVNVNFVALSSNFYDKKKLGFELQRGTPLHLNDGSKGKFNECNVRIGNEIYNYLTVHHNEYSSQVHR